jgi:hypothetical protein
MEWIVGAFAWIFALTLLWPFWIGFAILTFWLCAEEDWKFFGFLATLLIGSIIVRTFNVGWDEYRWYLLAYVPVGILWSFYRWERYGQYVRGLSQDFHSNSLKRFSNSIQWNQSNEYAKRLQQNQNQKASSYATEDDYKAWRQNYQREQLELRPNVDKISYWITSWPVSVLSWGLHDILTAVKRFITVWARRVYVAISERHIEK